MLKGFQNEAKLDAGAAMGSQLLDFGSQNLQNITKTASKISQISKLRRGCVFGAALGAKTVPKGANGNQKGAKSDPKTT